MSETKPMDARSHNARNGRRQFMRNARALALAAAPLRAVAERDTSKGVNYQKRTVTFFGAQAHAIVMKVHDAAQNLEQVQAGDKVRVRYLESTAIYLRRGDRDVPAAAQVDDVQLAAKDAPAGGVATRAGEITAEVEGVDNEQRWIHFARPLGRLVKVNVPESVEKFPNVRVGDMVVVRHTEALALQKQ